MAATAEDQLPDAARCVIIGGGVAGCSDRLPPGPAGLDRRRRARAARPHRGDDLALGRLRRAAALHHQPDPDDHVLVRRSTRELRELTGRDPGWRGVGGLRLATTPERVEELQRQASAATTYGLEIDLLSPAETADRLPLLDVDDVLAAGWLPGDGYLRAGAAGRRAGRGRARARRAVRHRRPRSPASRSAGGRVPP